MAHLPPKTTAKNMICINRHVLKKEEFRMLIKIKHFGLPFTENQYAKLVFTGMQYHCVIVY